MVYSKTSFEKLEGKICIEAALKARQRRFDLILIRYGGNSKNIESILIEAQNQNIPIKYISKEELDKMAEGVSHGGVIALCSNKSLLTLDTFLSNTHLPNNWNFLLLLEGIDDEQNLGFTLRTAEAMGVQAVLLKKHLWDFNSNIVSRASSGAFERIPVIIFEDVRQSIKKLRTLGFSVLGCLANAKRSIYDVDLTRPSVIAIGGEKRGLSASLRNECDFFTKIPMMSDVGSLSLGHSASIVMAEVMRQRLMLQRKDE